MAAQKAKQVNPMDGYGIYEWDEGQKYEGNWKDGKKEGQGTLTWFDKEKKVEC